MLSNPHIRPATSKDVAYIASNLRPADLRELEAFKGPDADPLDVLTIDASSTSECYVGIGENPLVLFGINITLPSSAFVWAIATPEVSQYSHRFLRGSREVIKHWFETYKDLEVLSNYTYAENTEHHRWLRWCRADLASEAVPYGPLKAPFLPFTILRSSYVS